MKSASAPIGSCSTSGLAFSRSIIISTQRKKFARAVELVDEAHARDAVLLGLPPDLLGLRLDAGDTVVDGDRTVEHPQRPLHLDGEVDARGVDDVDVEVVPGALRRGRRDGDAALLLLLHPVHRGRAVVDLTDLVVDTGVEEDALRSSWSCRRRCAP